MNFKSISYLKENDLLRVSDVFLRRLCNEATEAVEHAKTTISKVAVKKEPVSEGSAKEHYLVDIENEDIKKYLKVSEVLQEFIHEGEIVSKENVKSSQQTVTDNEVILKLTETCIELAEKAGQVKLLTDSESKTKEEYFKVFQENATLKAQLNAKVSELDSKVAEQKKPVAKYLIYAIVGMAIVIGFLTFISIRNYVMIVEKQSDIKNKETALTQSQLEIKSKSDLIQRQKNYIDKLLRK